MRKSPHFRWFEEAQAKKVQQFALLHRAVDEPHVTITYADLGPSWLAWFCSLGWRTRAPDLHPSPERSADRLTT
jgi:hypothetical protein